MFSLAIFLVLQPLPFFLARHENQNRKNKNKNKRRFRKEFAQLQQRERNPQLLSMTRCGEERHCPPRHEILPLPLPPPPDPSAIITRSVVVEVDAFVILLINPSKLSWVGVEIPKSRGLVLT